MHYVSLWEKAVLQLYFSVYFYNRRLLDRPQYCWYVVPKPYVCYSRLTRSSLRAQEAPSLRAAWKPFATVSGCNPRHACWGVEAFLLLNMYASDCNPAQKLMSCWWPLITVDCTSLWSKCKLWKPMVWKHLLIVNSYTISSYEWRNIHFYRFSFKKTRIHNLHWGQSHRSKWSEKKLSHTLQLGG